MDMSNAEGDVRVDPMADGGYRYGGFWIRVAAKLIDWVCLATLQIALGITTAPLLAVPGPDGTPAAGGLILIGLMNLALNLGAPAFFLGRFEATPGKMACGLRVIVADGPRITYLRALGRGVSEILSFLILLIGFMMAAFDPERRTLHDRICGTRVIRK